MSEVMEFSQTSEQARSPGRRRDDATRRAILRAAFDIIEADGYRAFTIEGVAARSGAGKTTIYRWWPSKEALAVDAFMAEIPQCGPAGSSGSAIEDLKATLARIAENLTEGKNGRVLAAILGGGQAELETCVQFRDRFLIPRRELGRAVVQRGIANGELRADLDVDAALEALIAPIYMRLLMRIPPRSPDEMRAFADTVIQGMASKAAP